MANVSVLNTDASLSAKTITTNETAETFSGIKTFSAAPVFSVAPAVNAGVKFPSTQVAVADVNTLDDYEEGTWTPVIASSGGGVPTYTTQVGAYIKIGKLVHLQGHIQLSGFNTLAAGNITITGLPFTLQSTAGLYSACAVSYWSAFGAAVQDVGGVATANTAIIDLVGNGGAGTASSILTRASLSATAQLIFTFSYIANA